MHNPKHNKSSALCSIEISHNTLLANPLTATLAKHISNTHIALVLAPTTFVHFTRFKINFLTFKCHVKQKKNDKTTSCSRREVLKFQYQCLMSSA